MQLEKISKGWNIFLKEGIHPTIWVAPFHTFDRNTLDALSEATTIRIVSDGLSLEPVQRGRFLWIPHQLWGAQNMKLSGVYTIGLHPNFMAEKEFAKIDSFISIHKEKFDFDFKEFTRSYSHRQESSGPLI